MQPIAEIRHEIMNAPANKDFTQQGWKPIFMAYPEARILIIGQAPGLKTQIKEDVFRDRSGARLRNWMGIDESVFYDSHLIAVLPMDFYFPGNGKSGDLPPRPDFAPTWHPRLLACMPHIALTILIGAYAQQYILKDLMKKNLTETVRSYKEYLPTYLPLVHPSPLNQRWIAKNPFFEEAVVPTLKTLVQSIINR